MESIQKSMPTKKTRNNLKETVYKELRHRIITSDLSAGQQLYEKEFMGQYGIGRTPLREIFHRLQLDGLIDIHPKLGTKVAILTLETLRETVQLRRELEGLAAKLASRNIVDQNLIKIRDLLDKANKIKKNEAESLIKMSIIDEKIHTLIYESAGNKQLTEIISTLKDKMIMYWFQVGFSAEDFKEQFEELEEMYEAISDKDSEKASATMKKHIDHFAELIMKNLF